MRILIVHNKYQYAGGEDAVVDNESALLSQRGHEVRRLVKDNGDLGGAPLKRLAAGLKASWNSDVYDTVRLLLREHRPDMVHVHNFLPIVTPCVFYACQDEGVPVAQTLHNYRILCPGANLFRGGVVCEDCVGRSPWRGVWHRCYKDSRLATAAVARMIRGHWKRGTWRDAVDVYIAPSQFGRSKFVQAGLPEQKIVVKPNFVRDDPGPGPHDGNFGLFVGRLSAEKGVGLMVEAWRMLKDVPLVVVGEGPLHSGVARLAGENASVTAMGRRTQEECLELMKTARFLIFPSLCYEMFPLVLAEAFACGLPVVASRLGAAAEVVDDGRTGLLFQAGSAVDAAEKIRRLWTDKALVSQMSRNARMEYEARYSAERNFEMLMQIYQRSSKSGKPDDARCDLRLELH